MKIDKELRDAVIATIRGRKKSRTDRDYTDLKLAKVAAVKAALRKFPALREAYTLREKLLKQLEAPTKVIEAMGMYSYGKDVNDTAKFIEATGSDFRPPQKIMYDPDVVLAELAEAAPEKMQEVLSKYGINWS